MRYSNVRISEHPGLSQVVKSNIRSVGDHLLLCNHWTSYNDSSILTTKLWKQNFFTRAEKEPFREINQLWIETLHKRHCTYLKHLSNKIFVIILFLLIVAKLFSLKEFFIIWSSMCMNTIVHDNDIVKCIFYLFIVKLILTLLLSQVHEFYFVGWNTCPLLFIIKAWKLTEKRIWNIVSIKLGLIRLAKIFIIIYNMWF